MAQWFVIFPLSLNKVSSQCQSINPQTSIRLWFGISGVGSAISVCAEVMLMLHTHTLLRIARSKRRRAEFQSWINWLPFWGCVWGPASNQSTSLFSLYPSPILFLILFLYKYSLSSLLTVLTIQSLSLSFPWCPWLSPLHSAPPLSIWVLFLIAL